MVAQLHKLEQGNAPGCVTLQPRQRSAHLLLVHKSRGSLTDVRKQLQDLLLRQRLEVVDIAPSEHDSHLRPEAGTRPVIRARPGPARKHACTHHGVVAEEAYPCAQV